MFVRHEDFLLDPEGVVRQILDRTGSLRRPSRSDVAENGLSAAREPVLAARRT